MLGGLSGKKVRTRSSRARIRLECKEGDAKRGRMSTNSMPARGKSCSKQAYQYRL